MLVQINTKVEKDIKEQAEEILSDLGLTISDAVRIFLKKVINYDGIPFSLKRNEKEHTYENLTNETKNGLLKSKMERNKENTYNSTEELFNDLGITNY